MQIIDGGIQYTVQVEYLFSMLWETLTEEQKTQMTAMIRQSHGKIQMAALRLNTIVLPSDGMPS